MEAFPLLVPHSAQTTVQATGEDKQMPGNQKHFPPNPWFCLYRYVGDFSWYDNGNAQRNQILQLRYVISEKKSF